MNSLMYRFELDECVDWIVENKFNRIALQLKLNDLKFATLIEDYLKEKISSKRPNESIELYISQSSTCCVDLLVTQHISNLDALIHFGNVCLSKPHLNNQETHLPILFAFGRVSTFEEKFNDNIQLISNQIRSIEQTNKDSTFCIFYDTYLIEYANKLAEIFSKESLSIDIAKLHCLDSNWTTTSYNKSQLINRIQPNANTFGQHILSHPIDQYTHGIYIGDDPSIFQVLEGPQNLIRLINHEGRFEQLNCSKEMNKRIALVSRLKGEVELNIGVLITNPLPDVGNIMRELENYSQSRRHTLYFISMVQVIDECKIGNFDLCDAFVVVNSCNCSTILKSLLFNRPIITLLEYKLACGFEATYGKINWPGSTIQLLEDDLINRRKVSDVSLALIQTRNELLERCSQARANKWSGLEYSCVSKEEVGDSENPGSDSKENTHILEGLKGVASSYMSEPFIKTSHKN